MAAAAAEIKGRTTHGIIADAAWRRGVSGGARGGLGLAFGVRPARRLPLAG